MAEEDGKHKFGDTTFIRVRFFGEPWGNDNRRAPICDDDQYRIPVPVGTRCLLCTKQIEEHHRGVVTGCSPGIFGHWMLDIEGVEYPVCSYHLFCFVKSTIGSDGLSHEILSKMDYRVEDDVVVPPAEEESVEVRPGRGWGKEE